MKFSDHCIMAMHSARLAAASAAAVACARSRDEPDQVFDYAGKRFTGVDAALLKDALGTALVQIAEHAMEELKKGGITDLPEAPEEEG